MTLHGRAQAGTLGFPAASPGRVDAGQLGSDRLHELTLSRVCHPSLPSGAAHRGHRPSRGPLVGQPQQRLCQALGIVTMGVVGVYHSRQLEPRA